MWLFLRRKHIKEFYAEKLYNNKLPYIHNKNFNYNMKKIPIKILIITMMN